MDERLKFVARLLDGEKMAVLCREFDISRKTGYKILTRYNDSGLEGLTDRSRRPYRHANQLPFQIEKLIVRLKQDKPTWGAPKIRERLARGRNRPRLVRCHLPGCRPADLLKLARIAHGPLLRRVTGQGKTVGAERLNDQGVARLVKRTALAAGVRGDLSEGDRATKFSGHSLRAGLASSAEVDERYVQKQLGHASAEMTRRYQRKRDRFRVNLTTASGL